LKIFYKTTCDKKKSCIFALGFRITDIQNGRHINKILKIQSNEQKNVSTIEKKKEEISTDLWTEFLCEWKKSSARRRAKGRHKLTVSCEPRHKK
jgi:hypothetical protein